MWESLTNFRVRNGGAKICWNVLQGQEHFCGHYFFFHSPSTSQAQWWWGEPFLTLSTYCTRIAHPTWHCPVDSPWPTHRPGQSLSQVASILPLLTDSFGWHWGPSTSSPHHGGESALHTRLAETVTARVHRQWARHQPCHQCAHCSHGQLPQTAVPGHSYA